MVINDIPQELVPSDSITGYRKCVLLALYEANQLNDDNLPPDKMEMFLTKPFSDWSPYMQSRLRPYGASLIT